MAEAAIALLSAPPNACQSRSIWGRARDIPPMHRDTCSERTQMTRINAHQGAKDGEPSRTSRESRLDRPSAATPCAASCRPMLVSDNSCPRSPHIAYQRLIWSAYCPTDEGALVPPCSGVGRTVDQINVTKRWRRPQLSAMVELPAREPEGKDHRSSRNHRALQVDVTA